MSKTICLNMIVRNEESAVKDTIKSVGSFISHAVIMDTGSTDNTIKVCAGICKKIGLSHINIQQGKWKNFEYNRNEALELAKKENCDYIMLMDGRTPIVPSLDFKFPEPLYAGCYEILEKYGAFQYWRPWLIKSDLPWKWKQETHEYLDCEVPYRSISLSEIFRNRPPKTSEQNKEKLERDLNLLQEAAIQRPDDSRVVFYLAQTYHDLGSLKKALELYSRRTAMGNWDEEAWWALYQVACLKEEMKKPKEEVVAAYLEAYEKRSNRAEPLYRLAKYYRECRKYYSAFLYAQQAAVLPIPDDRMFIEHEVYTWRALDELSISAYYVGKYHLSELICNKILHYPISSQDAGRVLNNRAAVDRQIARESI
jgi:glycosyltransferase involved in cell wall biosynthesis